MALVDRVKNIVLTPKTEWPVIEGEAATTQSLYVGYIAILAAIGPIALIVGRGPVALPLAAISYGVALAVTYVLALIVDAVAPTFGGEKSFVQSLKLTAYSYTAAWVAGIFQLLPMLGGVIGLLASIYGFYTFYLGVVVMKKCPQDKAVPYTLVVVICAFLLGAVLGGLLLSLTVGGSAVGMMEGLK